jgi:hypothetical protein
MRVTALTALFCFLAAAGCTEEQGPPAGAGGPKSIMVEGALSQQEALKGLNENMPSIVPCTKAAGGQFVLMLSWQVQPDGSVTKIDVSRTEGEIDAALEECVTAAMKKWKFPKSQLGTRIEQIPVKVGVEG